MFTETEAKIDSDKTLKMELSRIFTTRAKKTGNSFPSFNLLIEDCMTIRGLRVINGRIHPPSLIGGNFVTNLFNRAMCKQIYELLLDNLDYKDDKGDTQRLELRGLDEAIVFIELDKKELAKILG